MVALYIYIRQSQIQNKLYTGRNMRIELLTVMTGEEKKKRTKPVDHFKGCPRCGNKVIAVDRDVICSSCDWDSTAWDVSRGAMDDLGRAAKEFLKYTPKPKKINLVAQLLAADHNSNSTIKKKMGA